MPDAAVPEEVRQRLGESNLIFVRDLHSAADEAAEYASTPQDRIYIGIPQLDDAIRGTARRQMTAVVGRPNAGKTLILGETLRHNPDETIMYASPDESALLIIAKLTAAQHGMSWERLEELIQDSDPNVSRRARDLLHETADRFPNLAVVEKALTPETLAIAVDEAERMTGNAVRCIFYDFSKLFRVEGNEAQKLDALKYWIGEHGYPLFVPHQVPKYSGREGAPITIDSMREGGEDVCTHIIGVRRKWRWYQSLIEEAERKIEKADRNERVALEAKMIQWGQEREHHMNTVTINLVKSKTPPGRTVDEFDMIVDRDSGRLSQIDGKQVTATVEQLEWL